MQGEDQLLSVTDAASILGLSETRVRNLADAKALPVTRTKRGVRLFQKADVDRLRRERELAKKARRAA